MIGVDVKSNTKEFIKGLNNHQKKQLPFATMKALNATLGDMRKEVIENIRQKQKSSKAWWNSSQYGINRIYATKQKPFAVLFTKMRWAQLQEEGGIKTPKGKHLAIPLERVPKARRKSGGARIMGAHPKAFFTEKGLFRKAGGKKNPRTELLFWFSTIARIRPLFGIKKTAHRTALLKFTKHFVFWLDRAIKTAK